MRFYLSVVLCLISLSGCQTLSRNNASTAANANTVFLPLAIAVQTSYQDEVNLLRLNQLFSEQKNIDEKERARLLYERGLIYDRMGLGAHSRYDLNQSINADPSFAPAYNMLGLYLLLSQSYDEAFEAFDSAIELSDGIESSYLHRAIGLYQIRRYSLASNDIEKFYDFDNNDPYRILWRYIIESKVDQQSALINLKNVQQADRDNRFAWSIVDVIAGRTTEKQFFSAISGDISTNDELAQRLCEAYFYLGYWYEISGDITRSIHYFKAVTATSVHDFIEYKYALMALASIQAQLTQQYD